MIDVKRLQAAVGVSTDGQAGVATFSALFHKCGATPDVAVDLAVCAARRFVEYGLMDSPLRLAHFLAQVIHESGGFRYMEEIWGPTSAQKGYEGRTDLGNTQPGDGYRYKGRGPIEVTGRANYRRMGRAIGIDIETHPELAAIPSIGLLVALQFWKEKGLNQLADADDIVGITHRVNGGENGLDNRRAQLVKLKGWML